MARYLCSRNVFVRFLSLYLTGILLFLVAWTLSYLLLPEGIIQGKNLASQISGGEAATSMAKEFIKIFAYNLFACSLIIAANLTLKIKEYPLGYLIPLIWFIMYGMMLGTNSFTISIGEPMRPSFAVIKRSGIYEIMAYCMIAAATYSLSRNKMEKLFTRKSVPIREEFRDPIQKAEWITIGISIFILLLSNLRESYMILNM